MTGKKHQQKRGKKGQNILICLCVLVFLFSLYQAAKIIWEYKEGVDFYRDTVKNYTGASETEKEIGPPIEVDFERLLEINADIVGWIYMENTVVNYPLLQGKDNFYYLDKSYYKTYLASGSIFLDAANEADLSGRHSIVYGHNMKNSTMFGNLDDFQDPAYLQEHRYIDILLTGGNWLRYEICSLYRAGIEDGTYQLTFSEEEDFQQFLHLIDQKNIFRSQESLNLPRLKADDRLLTLSTCTEDSSDTERFVIHARLLTAEEKEKSLL